MDVIDAARKISEAGTKLDDLARKIADQCAESTTKKDLLAYLERITLYCHQLNITSRVRNTKKSPNTLFEKSSFVQKFNFDKTPTFSRVFHHFFNNFSREIKVVNS